MLETFGTEEATEMLKQENIKIDSIKFFPKNARVHRKKNLDSIRASLARFGQVEPLVVQKSTSFVLGGNGRLEAMRSLGWNEASCVFVDISDKEALALSVALNRTSELSEWDIEALQDVMSYVKDDKDLLPGWSDDELSAMLTTTWEVEELEEVLNDDLEGAQTEREQTPSAPEEPLHQATSTNSYVDQAAPSHVASVADHAPSVLETAILFAQHENIDEFVAVCVRAATIELVEADVSPEQRWEKVKEKAE
jgi:hypothetical protein